MSGPDLAALLALEREVWAALIAGDPAADERRLASDFLGVYPSGLSGRAGHAGQLSGGPTVARYAISEARALPLGPEAAMLVYLAEYARPESPDRTERMWVSSLWALRDGEWLNVFSQDTPVGDPVP